LAVECLDCSASIGVCRLFALSVAAMLFIKFSRGVVDWNSAAKGVHEICKFFGKNLRSFAAVAFRCALLGVLLLARFEFAEIGVALPLTRELS
jgi:hypothetical protein